MGLGYLPLKAVQKHADEHVVLWAKLEARYDLKTTSTIFMLFKDLLNHRVSAGISLFDYIADIELSFMELFSAGEELDELL